MNDASQVLTDAMVREVEEWWIRFHEDLERWTGGSRP